MSVAALIVAAGRGSRMGRSTPKAFLTLGGMPILARAAAAFLSHPEVTLVVASVSDIESARTALGPEAGRVLLVQGGDLRQDSVRQGLRAIGREEFTLVHDAARPLVSKRVIDAVLEGTRGSGAAIPVIPVPDTVKRVAADGSIAGTLARDELRLAQTPQGFRTELLRAAYALAGQDGFVATDDASIVEHAGGRVTWVEGSPENFKITVPADLERAEALLRRGGGRSEGTRHA